MSCTFKKQELVLLAQHLNRVETEEQWQARVETIEMEEPMRANVVAAEMERERADGNGI